jgi:hypothetical protein
MAKINVDIPPVAIAPGMIVSFKGASGRVLKSTKNNSCCKNYTGVDAKLNETLFPLLRFQG